MELLVGDHTASALIWVFAFIFFFLHLETEPLGRLREWEAGNSGLFFVCFVFWWYPANLVRERREYRRRWREREIMLSLDFCA